MNPRRSIALLALLVAILLNLAAPLKAEPLRGELRRTVSNPWGVDSTIGWGLATDGNVLFASSMADGLIRIVDIPTLAIIDTIATPATNFTGLEYRDGILYGVEQRSVFPNVVPSRFYALDASTGDVEWTFDGPSDGFTSLSFGPDGYLYASDGFQGRGIAGTRIYAFDSYSGEVKRTLRPRVIGEPPDDGDEIAGTGMIQWLPGEQLLIEHRLGGPNQFQNLNLPTIENDVLIPGPVFDVPGLVHPDPKQGAALFGNTLYVWSSGRDGIGEFYEIQIVPEPTGGALVGAGAIAALAFALLRTRPSQQRAIVRGIGSA